MCTQESTDSEMIVIGLEDILVIYYKNTWGREPGKLFRKMLTTDKTKYL